MKTIYYTPKQTSANTQYVDIHQLDKRYIIARLRDLVEFCEIIATVKDRSARPIQELLVTPISDLPKHAQPPYGRNSIYTYGSGLLDNITLNGQRDFSEKNLDGLRVIFDVLHELVYDNEVVEFVQKTSKIHL